ncbi:MAG: 50S ribosomal protein L30 [Bryobacterales bacterium]|nr:50S ribosomal protein L30 [Bryobacteraceae bacterium]MDW8131823.1 50S ribosomal protein L30 [Bryobacterales bacterium]
MEQGKIRIKLVRSLIGRPEKQRQIARGLGLRRLNQVVEREDTPAIRGMIRKIPHLVKVLE